MAQTPSNRIEMVKKLMDERREKLNKDSCFYETVIRKASDTTDRLVKEMKAEETHPEDWDWDDTGMKLYLTAMIRLVCDKLDQHKKEIYRLECKIADHEAVGEHELPS